MASVVLLGAWSPLPLAWRRVLAARALASGEAPPPRRLVGVLGSSGGRAVWAFCAFAGDPGKAADAVRFPPVVLLLGGSPAAAAGVFALRAPPDFLAAAICQSPSSSSVGGRVTAGSALVLLLRVLRSSGCKECRREEGEEEGRGGLVVPRASCEGIPALESALEVGVEGSRRGTSPPCEGDDPFWLGGESCWQAAVGECEGGGEVVGGRRGEGGVDLSVRCKPLDRCRPPWSEDDMLSCAPGALAALRCPTAFAVGDREGEEGERGKGSLKRKGGEKKRRERVNF